MIEDNSFGDWITTAQENKRLKAELAAEREQSDKYRNALSTHVEGLKRAYAGNTKLREALVRARAKMDGAWEPDDVELNDYIDAVLKETAP